MSRPPVWTSFAGKWKKLSFLVERAKTSRTYNDSRSSPASTKMRLDRISWNQYPLLTKHLYIFLEPIQQKTKEMGNGFMRQVPQSTTFYGWSEHGVVDMVEGNYSWSKHWFQIVWEKITKNDVVMGCALNWHPITIGFKWGKFNLQIWPLYLNFRCSNLEIL